VLFKEVDMLAKRAVKMRTISQYVIPPQGQRNIIRRQVMKEWQNIWKQTKLLTPLKHYKEVQPYAHTKPWNNKYKLPQAIVRSIIEHRTQKGHQNPLRAKCNTNLCECGITDHIECRWLECINNSERITTIQKANPTKSAATNNHHY
jgi:hypothetical protein